MTLQLKLLNFFFSLFVLQNNAYRNLLLAFQLTPFLAWICSLAGMKHRKALPGREPEFHFPQSVFVEEGV